MQTNNTFSIIFFTRKSRNAKNQVSIYVRITVNKQRSEISLKRNVLFKEWDNTKNRGRGTSTKIRILNNYLLLITAYDNLVVCYIHSQDSCLKLFQRM